MVCGRRLQGALLCSLISMPCSWASLQYRDYRQHDHRLADEWDSLGQATAPRKRRQIVYFGSMETWKSDRDLSASSVQLVSRQETRRAQPSSNARHTPVRRTKRLVVEEDTLQTSRSRFWPPWPFSLLSEDHDRARVDEDYVHHRTASSNAAVFWVFLQHNLRVGLRQMQHVGSQLWFHLPSATPPLILLGFRPVRRTVVETVGDNMEEIVTKTIGPAILANPFVRKLTLASVCAAVLSWSHSELNRVRQLEPLPLPEAYWDVSKAILPPFLPEEVPEPEKEFLKSMETQVGTSKQDEEVKSERPNHGEDDKGLSPKIRRHLQQLYDVAPNPKTFGATIGEWRRMREARRLESEKVQRSTIADELIALQALKKRAKRRTKTRHAENAMPGEELGYALVTGSSRGIGRAIAVELARWEIPLILVARDVDRLASLARDIEACYGVKCCVLQADLSRPDAAERVYQTTKKAGLTVDILVNNAGLSSTGECVDMLPSRIQEMLQVNVMSVATLNNLYGKDMKERRRGRILVVSSVVGSVEAGPQVAVYAGSKAFEKSLATSMAKELEPYGVGVTCLLPGAVRGTDFRSRSGSNEALCWKLPYYAKKAADVANLGVRAMLVGDVECVPGWQNRAFLRVLKPILPQRLTTLIVEMAWSPFHLTLPRIRWGDTGTVATSTEIDNVAPPVTSRESRELRDLWSGATPKRTPRLLKMSDEEAETASKATIVEDSIPQLSAPDEVDGNGMEQTTLQDSVQQESGFVDEKELEEDLGEGAVSHAEY